MCGRIGGDFVFLIALFLLLTFVVMAETPVWSCGGSWNYPASSTFGHNRQQALTSLVGNVSLTGYYNVTVGKSPDQAIAAAQCRGDLDGEACQACVSHAASQVAQLCPNRKVAGLITQSCIMYVADTKLALTAISILDPNTIPNPQRFTPMLIFFFNKVIDSAITNPSGRLYWGDSFKYTQNLTIFGTAQCLQYLSPQACTSCLDEAFTLVLKDAANRTGASVFHNAECQIIFNIFPIFTPPPHKIAASNAISISTNCSPPISSNKFGSPFHRNLKALLSYLIVHTPFSGYYTDNVDLDSSQVYGEAFCRGDIPRDVCWYCIAEASTKVQELCPNSRRAIIWLDHCQLRYSDENFVGRVDVYSKACQSAGETESNPTSFDQNLRILIENLTSLAMQSSPIRFFATGMSLLPDSSQRIYALVQCVRDITADQCEWCLRNASSDIQECSHGKQGGRILRGSCTLAFGVQPFFLDDPKLVTLPQPTHGHHHRWIFVLTCLTAGLLLTATFASYLVQKRKRHLEKLKQKAETIISSESAEDDEATFDLQQISLTTIRYATDNFSESNKLAEGGYGPVYKGKLSDGQEIAVKRLSRCSRQGVKQFRNEVESMAKLQHINLVRLIGCCLDKREKMLIYEYMPNKSLDFFLKDPEGRALLDWEKRFNIITGIAKGMLYLHQDSRLNIIHRDLKASNVLLDEQLHPKISDFGLARIFSGVHGQTTTSVIVGTYGYMAPEYAMDGVFSTKSDVYSFGILLLEIISGRLNTASTCAIHGEGCELVQHAWRLWCEEKGAEFIDPILKDVTTSTSDQVRRCLHIGLLCIENDAATRPTMSTVVLMLGNNSLDLPLPTQPAFIEETDAETSLPRPSIIWPVATKSSTM